MSILRLDKYLADLKIGTRKEVGIYIRKGMVTINGEIVKKADTKIDSQLDIIAYNNEKLTYNEYIYIMLNKPQNTVSAREDGKCQTVIDILPEHWKRKNIAPAGRLDKNTTGLLVITDDGDFTHKMLAPKSHVYKIYEAELDETVTENDIIEFKNGISTATADFLPAELWLPNEDNKKIARVKIREGKFHQVKRMFAFCGKQVVNLKRLQIGGLELDEELSEGESKLLTKTDIEKIFVVNMH